MKTMHGLSSARFAVALAAIALAIVGCTAGTDTQYITAGLHDPQPADPLQDPAPIVEGLTAPTTSQVGQGDQGKGGGQTPGGKDGG